MIHVARINHTDQPGIGKRRYQNMTGKATSAHSSARQFLQ